MTHSWFLLTLIMLMLVDPVLSTQAEMKAARDRRVKLLREQNAARKAKQIRDEETKAKNAEEARKKAEAQTLIDKKESVNLKLELPVMNFPSMQTARKDLQSLRELMKEIPESKFLFHRTYKVYPPSHIQRKCVAKRMEKSNNIFLPQSAAPEFGTEIEGGCQCFRIRNGNKHIHCGVMEYTAPDGRCYMPLWMMEYLNLNEGDDVTLDGVTRNEPDLLKIEYVVMRAPNKFMRLPHPQKVIEKVLKKGQFKSLTQGTSIMVTLPDLPKLGQIELDILEVGPGDAVSIHNADFAVVFAEPLDYVKDPSFFSPVEESVNDNDETD